MGASRWASSGGSLELRSMPGLGGAADGATEQLLCTYQAAAHMLRYVLEPAGAGADNEGVARGREELAAARARLTGPAELLDALGAC